MGLFDSGIGGALKGMLGQVEAAAVPALISAALAKTNIGDSLVIITFDGKFPGRSHRRFSNRVGF